MSERNLLLIALSTQMRFPTIRGLLKVEDLFQMPLTAGNGFSLNDCAKSINASIKLCGEESFVATGDDVTRKILNDQLDVVKLVIDWRQELNREKADKLARRVKRTKLLEALDNREQADMAAMSKDAILKALEELD